MSCKIIIINVNLVLAMVRISYDCRHDGTSSSSFGYDQVFVVGGEQLPFSIYQKKIKEYIYFIPMVFYCAIVNMRCRSYEKFGLEFV